MSTKTQLLCNDLYNRKCKNNQYKCFANLFAFWGSEDQMGFRSLSRFWGNPMFINCKTLIKYNSTSALPIRVVYVIIIQFIKIVHHCRQDLQVMVIDKLITCPRMSQIIRVYILIINYFALGSLVLYTIHTYENNLPYTV